jgi:hypothetical protein
VVVGIKPDRLNARTLQYKSLSWDIVIIFFSEPERFTDLIENVALRVQRLGLPLRKCDAGYTGYESGPGKTNCLAGDRQV